MKTLDKLRKEILSSNTFNILEPLDSLVQTKPKWGTKRYEKWSIKNKKCWNKINKKLGIGNYGELRVRKSSKFPANGRTDVESFFYGYSLSLDILSYGITREIAEMMYEGFQELWQLPTDSRTYECRAGGFGGGGRATDITYGGKKGYFVNMRTNLGDSYRYLESIISEELRLVTPPLTSKDVRTKKLVGKSWAELTDKAKEYYDTLTEEGFYKYLLPY